MVDDIYITREEWEHISDIERNCISSALYQNNIKNTDYTKLELKNTFYVRYGKRMIDILLSSLALIILFPANLIIAIVTYFDVGKPILFRQERAGKDGKPFYLVKFRNMTNETNEDGILLPPDQRVTKWGKIVRSKSFDEFLNFISIFKGDMSIIGPRPLLLRYYERFSPYHQQRHLVRPGLECPFHDNSLAKEGWNGRLDNDVWYVENIGFKTDIKMAFKLVKKVFSKREREESASGKTGEFMGYDENGNVIDEFTIPRRYLEIIGR